MIPEHPEDVEVVEAVNYEKLVCVRVIDCVPSGVEEGESTKIASAQTLCADDVPAVQCPPTASTVSTVNVPLQNSLHTPSLALQQAIPTAETRSFRGINGI